MCLAADDQLKLLIGLLAGFVIVISLVSIIICKVRAWTIKTPETLPSSLVRFHTGQKQTVCFWSCFSSVCRVFWPHRTPYAGKA